MESHLAVFLILLKGSSTISSPCFPGFSISNIEPAKQFFYIALAAFDESSYCL